MMENRRVEAWPLSLRLARGEDRVDAEGKRRGYYIRLGQYWSLTGSGKREQAAETSSSVRMAAAGSIASPLVYSSNRPS